MTSGFSSGIEVQACFEGSCALRGVLEAPEVEMPGGSRTGDDDPLAVERIFVAVKELC